MKAEELEDPANEIKDIGPDLSLDEISNLENGLKASRWHERARAAEAAAATLVKDGSLRRYSTSEEGLRAKPDYFLYDRLLRYLLRGLALKDTQWQVRKAAVESAGTILAAAESVLPTPTFAEYWWVVLASCLDGQPEVQSAATECVSQHVPSFKRHGIVTRLCDRFVEAAATAGISLASKDAKLSTHSNVVGLDNLPDGELLVQGLTGAVALQILPLPASDGEEAGQEPDRIPLLLTVVAIAHEDADRRQSRSITRGLFELLRCLGAPPYRQSLLQMFNPRTPVFLLENSLARTYAGIISEETSDLLENVKPITLLQALSVVCGSSRADGVRIIDTLPHEKALRQQPSENVESSEAEVIALRQILKMLHVPDELTRRLDDKQKESKASDFIQLSAPLLSIATSIIEGSFGDRLSNQSNRNELVEDILLCCATFAGGDGEYRRDAAAWTSKELRELSKSLLTCLASAATVPIAGARKVSANGGLEDSPSAKVLLLISQQIPSVMPRIKQVIQTSGGGIKQEYIRSAPEGSVILSVVAACQMHWLLRQLEYPYLGPHCQVLMPCVLTALDHFSPEIKREAMGTFIHLAHNMNPTELRWYKDVILDAVTRTVTGSEDLWSITVKMAVVTVTRIEGRNPRSPWYGRIFSTMIEEIGRQRHDRGRRIVWLQEIPPLLEAMGLVLVAHFKRLLPLLYEWLHSPDDTTRILTLAAIQILITQTWPRIPAHLNRLWKEVSQTYQETRDKKSSLDIQIAVFGVCKQLKLVGGSKFDAIWERDIEDKPNDELAVFLKQLKAEESEG